jgi:hypothetical protein
VVAICCGSWNLWLPIQPPLAAWDMSKMHIESDALIEILVYCLGHSRLRSWRSQFSGWKR